jgi:aspartate kinase
MPVIVQKYGGSSLADADRIKKVAKRIARAKDAGNDVVVVVSAMGDTTDMLVELAKQVTDRPDRREMDMLLSTGELVSSTIMAMALHGMGYPAISLTGAQAGIYTDALHSRASIQKVEAKRVSKELTKGSIVIVAGFQGITEAMDITTLGRGGSDTTAVALAAALGAKLCEVYTDVEGVYTADPHIVPEARKLPEIGYDEMLELASHGARVMHSRAVELGELHDMPVFVASSMVEAPGTLIHREVSMEAKNKVRGVAHDFEVAKITIVGVPDRPGIAEAIFVPLAEAGISVDTIVQNASVENITDLTFTVARGQEGEAMAVVKPIAAEIGARECLSNPSLGKVSIVGTGMQNAPGYAARMFRALSEQNINIQMITTSEIRITCIIDEGRVKDAVRALHRAFKLDAGD